MITVECDEEDEKERKIGLRIAHYLMETEAKIPVERLQYLVLRLSSFRKYSMVDVNLVCQSCEMVLARLMTGVHDGELDVDRWITLLRILTFTYNKNVEKKDLIVEVNIDDILESDVAFPTNYPRQTIKAMLSIRRSVQEFVLRSGLFGKVIGILWGCDLKRVTEAMWKGIPAALLVKDEATKTTEDLLKLFDCTGAMCEIDSDNACELFFGSLARIDAQIRGDLAWNSEYSNNGIFNIHDKFSTEFYLVLNYDEDVVKHACYAYLSLIKKCAKKPLVPQCVRYLEIWCDWNIVSAEELCARAEPELWEAFFSLSSSIPLMKSFEEEMSFDGTNWIDDMIVKIPASMDEKSAGAKSVKSRIMRAYSSMIFLTNLLIHGKSEDHIMGLFLNYYQENAHGKWNNELSERVDKMYKVFVQKGILTEAQQMDLVDSALNNEEVCTSPLLTLVMESTPEEKLKKMQEHVYNICKTKVMQEDPAITQVSNHIEAMKVISDIHTEESAVAILRDVIDFLLEHREKYANFSLAVFNSIIDSCLFKNEANKAKIHLTIMKIAIEKEKWEKLTDLLAELYSNKDTKPLVTLKGMVNWRQMDKYTRTVIGSIYANECVKRNLLGKHHDKLTEFYCGGQEFEFMTKFVSGAATRERQLFIVNSMTENFDMDCIAGYLTIPMSLVTESEIPSRELLKALIKLSHNLSCMIVKLAIDTPLAEESLRKVICMTNVLKYSCFERLNEGNVAPQMYNFLSTDWKVKSGSDNMSDVIFDKPDEPLYDLHCAFALAIIELLVYPKCYSTNPANDRDDVVQYLVYISCLCAVSPDASQKAIRRLKKLFGQEKADRIQLKYVLGQLIQGGTDHLAPQPYEALPLADYLNCAYFEMLFINVDKLKDVHSVDEQIGNLSFWLEECAREGSSNRLNECVVQGFFETTFLEKMPSDISNRIIDIFARNIHLLPKWLKKSQSPITIMARFAPYLQHIYSAKDTDREMFLQAISESVSIVISEEAFVSLYQNCSVIVQQSDRKGLLDLNLATRPKETDISTALRTENGQLLAIAAFSVFANFAHDLTMVVVIDRAIKLIEKTFSSFSEFYDQFMMDVENVEMDMYQRQKALFSVMIATDLMEFCSEVARHLYVDIEDSDFPGGMVEIISTKITEKISQTEPTQKLCTVKFNGASSDNPEFVKQPWYNCYDCEMVYNKGVCSVCAVTCHKGHDLAYAKSNAFFCDCGAAGCKQSKVASTVPQPMDAVRGCYPTKKEPVSKTDTNRQSPFDLRIVKGFSDETKLLLKNTLKSLFPILLENENKIEMLGRVAMEANSAAWSVKQIQTAIVEKYEKSSSPSGEDSRSLLFEEMDKINISKLNMIPPRTPLESGKPRDTAAVLHLENGEQVWAILADTGSNTINLFYLTPHGTIEEDITKARHETEVLAFEPVSLYADGDKLLVWGTTDVMALRFSLTGEVITRTTTRVGSTSGVSSQSNHVVKAVWSSGPSMICALATVQFIRIYNYSFSLTQQIEELVLPVGNFEDMCIVEKGDNIVVFVLSSSGFLYEHPLTTLKPSNNSSFLTNTIVIPSVRPTSPNGQGTSLFYSKIHNILFASYEKGFIYSPVPSCTSLEDGWSWSPVDIDAGVHCWREDSAYLSCLIPSKKDSILFIFPHQHFHTQITSTNRSIVSHVLVRGFLNEAIYSAVIHADAPTLQIYKTKWEKFHDVYMDEVQLERLEISHQYEKKVKTDSSTIVPREYLPLLAEACAPIDRIEWSSDELCMFYEKAEMKARLFQIGSMPVIAIQHNIVTLTAKITDSRVVPRAIRLEVPAEKGPTSITICDKKYELPNSGMSRAHYINLSREETYALINKQLVIQLAGPSGQTHLAIISLQILGASRAEMEECKSITEFVPAMTLPNRFVNAVLKNMTMLYDRGSLQEKYKAVAERIANTHLSLWKNNAEVVESASRLLLSLAVDPASAMRLTEIRDIVLLNDMLLHMDSGCGKETPKLSARVVKSITGQLRIALTSRYHLFMQTLREKKRLSGEHMNPRDLFNFFVGHLKTLPVSQSTDCIEILTQIMFAVRAEGSDELTAAYFQLYYDKETCHLAPLLRVAAQSIIYKYMFKCRRDRDTLQKTVEDESNMKVYLIKKTGLRYYDRARLLKLLPDMVPVCSVLFGELVDAESILKKDMFDYECAWLNEFLKEALDVLHRHAGDNSMPVDGINVGSHESPAMCVTMLITFVMGQFVPSKVMPHVTKILETIRYDVDSLVPLNPENFSNFCFIRLLGILITRWSSDKKDESTPEAVSIEDAEKEKKKTEALLTDVAKEMTRFNVLDHAYLILNHLTSYWKSVTAKTGKGPNKGLWQKYLKSSMPSLAKSLPENGLDATENYLEGVTYAELKLPVHLIKMGECKLSDKWTEMLCRISYTKNNTVRQQCRKLLLLVCDNKEHYHAIKEKHRMTASLNLIRTKYFHATSADATNGYLQLTEIVDLLNAVALIAEKRPQMWREICQVEVIWLLQLACRTTDVVSCAALKLILLAVRDSNATGDECMQLADQILGSDDGSNLLKVLSMRYLIGKDELQRWLLHGLLRSLIQLAARPNQIRMVKCLYDEVFNESREIGLHGAQIVDLISVYAPRLFTSTELTELCDRELSNIEGLWRRMRAEGHHETYKMVSELGFGFGTMLLSTSPCLKCFTKKGVAETMKVSTIKQDSKFLSHAMIHKLNSHYELNKVVIKLGDIKKRSIKTVKLYYCNTNVESMVDLKQKRTLWRPCATANANIGDTEITLSLVVPVVTSIIIVEFVDVIDTRPTNELTCPKCSATVTSLSGVCDNCGENAHQCVKCRAIYYENKDPFLCRSCGTCKYARIDLYAVGRQLAGAQHITCDSERTQCMEEMSKLLIQMENTRAELTTHKAFYEALWMKARPLSTFDVHVENNHAVDYFAAAALTTYQCSSFATPVMSLGQVSFALRTTHEELCAQTQKLIAYREELKRYDSTINLPPILYAPGNNGFYATSPKCFGCMSAGVHHSIALLQSACDDEFVREDIGKMELLFTVLADLGNTYDSFKAEVEYLYQKLIIDNRSVQKKIERLIEEGKMDISVISNSLLNSTDEFWQDKLKFLVKYAMEHEDPSTKLLAINVLNVYLENSNFVRQRILDKHLEKKKKKRSSTKKEQSPTNDYERNRKLPSNQVLLDWLTSDKDWSHCVASNSVADEQNKNKMTSQLQWISKCIFSHYAPLRCSANRLLVSLFKHPGHRGVAVNMLLESLKNLHLYASNISEQFMHSATTILSSASGVKTRLFTENLHLWLIRLIHKDCKMLYEQERCNEVGALDHAYGSKLRNYVELLTIMFTGSAVETVLLKLAEDALLVPLLQSTFFLKRMVVRRTRGIDASRQSLEKLLRSVSWRDGRKLLRASVVSLNDISDVETQAHIVSVLLETLDPQQKVDDDFHIQIEKDPMQEDFLQGRMTGNPYKSGDVGMGPLMRDIKNKICRDTEMIALMEDDNGMELLVCNNIINLALPVRAVYEKLWRRTHPNSPMLIVYRMRGLMGDAVETFISALDVAEEENEEDESLGQMVKCLVDCGGLVSLLNLVKGAKQDPVGRFLLGNLRKLFEKMVKSSAGRTALVLNDAAEVFITVMRQCCTVDGMALIEDNSRINLGLDFYHLVEATVTDTAIHPILRGVSKIHISWLINILHRRKEYLVNENKNEEKTVLEVMSEAITKNLGSMVLGNKDSEDFLVVVYKHSLQWEQIEQAMPLVKDQMVWMVRQLAEMSANMLPTETVGAFKQKLLDSGVVDRTCYHLLNSKHAVHNNATEAVEFAHFLKKETTKLMLELLAGLSKGHEPTQRRIARDSLHILHRLEQVATENSIGTLAEAVMDQLKANKEIAAQIEEVRLETRQKKKQMAMAMRAKQLTKMGMMMGKGGEVKVASRHINEPAIDDYAESSVACCICREPALQGKRASAVYAYAYAANDDDEPRAILTTVSQMVMIHVECHNHAAKRPSISSNRSHDEWNQAQMHNAGARCNVLTPIGLEGVDDWDAVMSKFRTDLDHIRNLGQSGITRQLLYFDMCHLVDRFVFQRSFSDRSQGGGRESNMQYLGIVHLLALSLPADGDLQCNLPRHRLVTFLFTELTLSSWNEERVNVLQAALNDAQTTGAGHEWDGLKSIFMTWAFVDKYFNTVITITGDDRLEWLRSNLQSTLRKTSKMVEEFDGQVIKIDGYERFCTYFGILEEDVKQFFEPIEQI